MGALEKKKSDTGRDSCPYLPIKIYMYSVTHLWTRLTKMVPVKGHSIRFH